MENRVFQFGNVDAAQLKLDDVAAEARERIVFYEARLRLLSQLSVAAVLASSLALSSLLLIAAVEGNAAHSALARIRTMLVREVGVFPVVALALPISFFAFEIWNAWRRFQSRKEALRQYQQVLDQLAKLG